MKKILAMLMGVFVLLCVNPVTRATAEEKLPTVLFNETFGDTSTVSPQPLTTSKTEGYGGWRLETNVYDRAKTEGTEITIENESESNNILHMKRTTANGDHVNLIAMLSLPSIPQRDTVKLSWRMKYTGANYYLFWRNTMNAIRSDYVTLANGHKFEPQDAEETAAISTKNVWHNYELVINYTAGNTALYIDSVQIGAVCPQTFELKTIELLQPRHHWMAAGDIYLDDIEIIHIPDPEWVVFEDIANGQHADNVTQNLNLLTTKDIYTISWESSNTEVISNTGDVTVPTFIDETVRLTATIKLTATGAELGTRSFDVVVPSSGEVLYQETFENAEAGSDFVTDVVTGYNGWVLDGARSKHNGMPAPIERAKAEGTTQQLVFDPDYSTNKVLRLERSLQYPYYPSPVDGGEVVNWISTKTITGTINSGIVYFSSRLWFDSSLRLMFEPFGSIRGTKLVFTANFNNGRAYELTTEEQALWEKQTWNTFGFLLNFDDKTAQFYVNGQPVGPEVVMSLKALSVLSLYLPRNEGGGTHYIDNLTAKRATLTDAESVAKALAKVTVDAPVEGVTKNLTLQNASSYGTTISWSSSRSDVIAPDGTVTRAVDEDVSVTLTATVSKNHASQSKDFTVIVKGVTKLEYEANALHFSEIGNGQQAAMVTENLDLKETFTTDEHTTVMIEWSSSNEEVVSSEGVVTLPDYNTIVILTAKLYEENNPDTYVERDFQVTVLGRGTSLFEDSFESDAYTVGEQIHDKNGWKQTLYDNPHGHDMTLEKDLLDSNNHVMKMNKIEQATATYDVNQEPMDHTIARTQSGILSYSLRFMMTNANNSIGLELLNEKNEVVLLTAIYADRWRHENRTVSPAVNTNYKYADSALGISTLALNTWHTAEAIIDFDRGFINFYMDGMLLSSNENVVIDHVSTFRIKAQRFEPLQQWYVDDVVLRSLDVANGLAVKDAADAIALNSVVSENFVLPVIGEYGTVISWESSDNSAIEIVNNLAVLKREKGTAKTVRLTATVTKNGAELRKDFNLTLTAISDIEEVISNFTDNHFAGNQKSWHITDNMSLPEAYSGASIRWTSSNPEVLSDSGVVARGRRDVPVTLTADFSLGSETFTKTFDFVIAGTGTVHGLEDFSAVSTEGQSVDKWNGWTIEEPGSGQVNSVNGTIERELLDVLKPYADAEKVLTINRFKTKLDANVSNQKIKKSFSKIKAENIRVDFDFMFRTAQSTLYVELEGMQRHYAISRTGMGLKGLTEHAFGKTLEINRWYHITIEQDAYNNTYTLYLDYEKLNNEPVYAPGNRTISGINFYSNTVTTNVYEGFMVRRIMLRNITPDPAWAVATAKESLTLGQVDYSTCSLALPRYGLENTAISWQSDKPEVINSEGTVTRQAYQQEVTLTATIKKGNVSDTKSFLVTVFSTNGTEIATVEVLQTIAKTLSEESITDEPRLRLTKDLVLPAEITTGKAADIGGVDIIWESNYPAIVSAEGKITKQPYEAAATLTATLRAKANPSVSVQKKLKFAVELGGSVYHDFHFEDVPIGFVGEELNTWCDMDKREANRGTEYGTQFFADKEPAHAALSHEDANHVMFLNRYTSAKYDAVTTMSHATIKKALAGEYYYGDMLALSFRVKFLSESDNLRMSIFCLRERSYQIRPTTITISGNTLNYVFPENLALNEWHDVVFYFDMQSWRVDVYVNGDYILSEPLEYGKGPYGFLNQWRFFNDRISPIILDDIRVRSFSVTTGQEVVSEAMNKLTVPGELAENIDLPSCVGRCAITWKSSDESVITDGGRINPAFGGSKSATLTATFRYDNIVETKNYSVTVPALTQYEKDYEISGVVISQDKMTGVTVNRKNERTKEAKLIVVVYDQNAVCNIYSYDMPAMAAGTTQTVQTAIDLSALTHYKVRAFVWDYYDSSEEPSSNVYFVEEEIAQ